MTRVVAGALRGFANAENTRRFLQDAATYAHQLNVLLPLLAFVCGVGDLGVDIRTILNRLRKLRNGIAHDGVCAPQTHEAAAEHIAAAIFGVRYSIHLQEAIDAARLSGKLPRPSEKPADKRPTETTGGAATEPGTNG